MPRKARVFIPGGTYHVYCRVARGEPVFADETQAESWITTVGSMCRLHGLTVLAWCLMSNHYHLVVRTGELALWRAMARIQVRVAQHHNRCRRVLGRLWQSRYKARYVEDQDYFGQLVAYVHLNPVAAGMVDDPADYPNSGHAALIGRAPARLVDCSAALRGFGDSHADARRGYLTWVRTVFEAHWLHDEVRSLPWWKKVRDDEQTLEESDAPSGAQLYDGSLCERPPRLMRHSLGSFRDWFEGIRGLRPGQLSGRTHTKADLRERLLFTALAIHLEEYPAAGVAGILGRSKSTVSRWVSQTTTLLAEPGSFGREVANLREAWSAQPPATSVELEDDVQQGWEPSVDP